MYNPKVAKKHHPSLDTWFAIFFMLGIVKFTLPEITINKGWDDTNV